MNTRSDDTLLIRADAGISEGIGHVMRCLGLAQAWQDTGGNVVFVTATQAPRLVSRIESEGIEVKRPAPFPGSIEDAKATVSAALECNARWVAVDGYHFGWEYQHVIKEAGLPLLFFDDYGHASYYYADIVLNQNCYANENLYTSKEPHTRLLLGTQYTLLRREFMQWREWKRDVSEKANRVLVTLGGGDPGSMAIKVIKAVNSLKDIDLEVRVVLGPASDHDDKLSGEIKKSTTNMKILRDVNDMTKLMAWADAAVSGCGTTCWEMAFMGLPAITAVLAHNQREIAEGLSQAGVVINLGWFAQVSSANIAESLKALLGDPVQRRSMSANGKKIIDGGGSGRVISAMRG